jgi:hypothetical protein
MITIYKKRNFLEGFQALIYTLYKFTNSVLKFHAHFFLRRDYITALVKYLERLIHIIATSQKKKLID